jgi:hypothetical protein
MRSLDPNLPPSVELEAAKAKLPPPAPQPAPEEEVVLAWRVHLARRRPLHALIVVVVILAVMGWAGVVFSFDKDGKLRPSIMPALVFGLILAGALSELLFPISYRLTGKGAYRRNFLSATQIEWRSVRKCYLAADGVKLSPLPRPTRLEAFRGVFLRFGDDNREEIIARVTQLRDAARKPESAAGAGSPRPQDGARNLEPPDSAQN